MLEQSIINDLYWSNGSFNYFKSDLKTPKTKSFAICKIRLYGFCLL